MTVTNDIVLRPRFKMELERNNQTILKAFEDSKSSQIDFIVTRVNDHVFIRLPKQKQHFWSPELHLEINAIDENKSILYGLFGPKPAVWTMFMFFHFFVAGLFIVFGIWAYSNWSLKMDFALQLAMMIFMVVMWIGLYFGGRLGKATGKDQMHELYDFMNKFIRTESK